MCEVSRKRAAVFKVKFAFALTSLFNLPLSGNGERQRFSCSAVGAPSGRRESQNVCIQANNKLHRASGQKKSLLACVYFDGGYVCLCKLQSEAALGLLAYSLGEVVKKER